MASVTKKEFGEVDGAVVDQYTITNAKGGYVELLTYGATIRSWFVHDKDGNLVDIVLGYDDIQGYLSHRGYLGHVVGRVANRISRGRFELNGQVYDRLHINNGPNALHGDYIKLGGSLGKTIGRVCNRIRGGRFPLNGRQYQLAVNKPPNHCHGGNANFSKKIWSAEVLNDNSIAFSCSSADGEEGYPGAVKVKATYTLSDENELNLTYEATVEGQSTPLNLTNHAYFNLNGELNARNLDNHKIQLFADHYLPADSDCLVTGEIKAVADTLYDLQQGASLTEQLKALQAAGERNPKAGYDNNFCVTGADGKTVREAAIVTSSQSGIRLTTRTNQPGVQLYTANGLNVTGKGGRAYGPFSSFCLETQGYPDAVNNPNFPSVIVSPGETYQHTCVYAASSIA